MASIHVSHKEISWKTTPTGDVMQQPHFYIVYRFAAGEPVDLSQSSHIVAITRQTSYKPSEKRKGKYHYVVTVVDRCWNESEPSKTIKW